MVPQRNPYRREYAKLSRERQIIRASDVPSENWDQEHKTPMAEAALKKLGWDEVCQAVSQYGSTALGRVAAEQLQLPDTRQGTEVTQRS